MAVDDNNIENDAVAIECSSLPRLERELFVATAEPPPLENKAAEVDVDMKDLLLALADVMRRAQMFSSHHVEREALSTRERMSAVLEELAGRPFVPFVALFRVEEGKLGVVVTFLAVLELVKESLVEIVQTEVFGPIHVKAKQA